MNVFGDVIDECGDIGVEEVYLIYCFVLSYEEQFSVIEFLEMGVKVIDLICLFVKGGKIGLFGGVGVGKIVNMMEFINNIVLQYLGLLVFVGVGECICEGNDFYYEMQEVGVVNVE